MKSLYYADYKCIEKTPIHTTHGLVWSNVKFALDGATKVNVTIEDTCADFEVGQVYRFEVKPYKG